MPGSPLPKGRENWRMIQVEAEGKTLEEALLKASQKLRVPSSSVGYELLERKGGLWGILGRKGIRIKAWIQQEETIEAQLFLEELLRKARLECRLTQIRAEDEVLTVHLEGEDSGLLLQKEGELLEALGYLTARALSKKTGQHKRVLIDIGGFRARREQELREKALRAAKEAMRRGSAALGPLTARDRRIVHLFLKERPGLASRSIGQGPLRRVLITRESSPGHPGADRPTL